MSRVKFGQNYEVKDSILCHTRQGKPLIVIQEQLIETVIDHYHNKNFMANVCRDKLLEVLKKRYYWSGMHEAGRKALGKSFKIEGIDILGPLKRSRIGNLYVFLCVCLFTN